MTLDQQKELLKSLQDFRENILFTLHPSEKPVSHNYESVAWALEEIEKEIPYGRAHHNALDMVMWDDRRVNRFIAAGNRKAEREALEDELERLTQEFVHLPDQGDSIVKQRNEGYNRKMLAAVGR